ncbi:MAG: flippase-like domain-containing protein [Patescibacteria group bacterium]|nr:flippase-like domain-containing protein [Patescibacteria group bacterium]
MNSTKKLLLKIIFPLLLLLFAIIFILRLSDLQKFLDILSQGVWYYVALFIMLQIFYLITQTALIGNLYRIYGKNEPFKNIFNLFLATNFTNLAIPLGGISGIATFVGYAQKINLRKTQALIINILMYVAMFLSFSLAILLVLVLPQLQVNLGIAEKNIMIFFSIVVIALSTAFFVLLFNKRLLQKIINFLANFANKISQKFSITIISSEKVQYILGEFSELKNILKNKIAIFIKALGYGFIGHALHLMVLWVIFLAFGANVPLMVAAIGYAISVVFIVVSITPMGVGIVEPLMIAFFASCGISLELATIVTFVFRGIVFWLPFIWGFWGLKYINFLKIPSKA